MNYPFKDRYTRDPQHDSEGFTLYGQADACTGMDAKCRGCRPDEMCPRSGHCERYMSPLRKTHGIAAGMVTPRERYMLSPAAFGAMMQDQQAKGDALRRIGADEIALALSASRNYSTHEEEVLDARRLVAEADAQCDAPHGTSKLRDSVFPDTYFGWRR
jgi:hypothetical protein